MTLPTNETVLLVRKFIEDVQNPSKIKKLTDSDWSNFCKNLENIEMAAKSISVRMARHYSVWRPLSTGDVLKIPAHIRGYGIAGAFDEKAGYTFLDTLSEKNYLSRSAFIQAVEGWIAGDPCKIVADYYISQSFCLDKWVTKQIELAEWGDPLRAAAKIAIKNKRYVEWAFYLINNKSIGDGSNAAVDLLEAKMLENPNYVIEILHNDKIGCPSSAAQRLRDKKVINQQTFREIVKKAKSGDPANVVQKTNLGDDREFAEKIAEEDIGVTSPRLAIWLVLQKRSDSEWAYKVVKKSKFPVESHYLDMLMQGNESCRQTKRSANCE